MGRKVGGKGGENGAGLGKGGAGVEGWVLASGGELVTMTCMRFIRRGSLEMVEVGG